MVGSDKKNFENRDSKIGLKPSNLRHSGKKFPDFSRFSLTFSKNSPFSRFSLNAGNPVRNCPF